MALHLLEAVDPPTSLPSQLQALRSALTETVQRFAAEKRSADGQLAKMAANLHDLQCRLNCQSDPGEADLWRYAIGVT